MRLATIAIALGAAVASSASHALLVDCSADFRAPNDPAVLSGGNDATVLAGTSCQYVSPLSNSYVANTTLINNEGFFGFTNWNYLEQQTNANALSGTWSLTSNGAVPFSTANDYMIAFKDGSGTSVIGFYINDLLYSSGTWESPFRNPPFTALGADQIKDVSHYSIFYRNADTPDPPQEIPEPGTLALLGMLLIGAGVTRRGRRIT
jgi:hypothetical protein